MALMERYDAFISYSHVEDNAEIAEALHKKLERYRIPSQIQKITGKKKIERVFRDKEELPLSANLTENIYTALDNSEYLIVLCSPESRASQWVQREIEYFAGVHGKERIFAVLIKGEPEEVFPPILCEKTEIKTDINGQSYIITEPVEPLAADVRGYSKKERLKKLDAEFLRLIAGILQCPYDELKQRHQEYRMKIAITAMSAVMFLGIAFGMYSSYQRNQVNTAYQQSLINQMKNLSEESERYLDGGDRISALETALEVQPEGQSAIYPIVPEQIYALNKALYTYQHSSNYIYKPEKMKTMDGVVTDVNGFSPDGSLFFALDSFGQAYFYDTDTEKVVWKINAKKVFETTGENFIWGKFNGNHSIVMATEHYFVALDVEKQSCGAIVKTKKKNQKDQAMDVCKNKLAVCYQIKKENAEYDSINLFIYDMEKGELSNTYDCISEKEYSIYYTQISKIVFSEDGNYLAVGKINVGLLQEDTEASNDESQKSTIYVYNMKDGKIVQKFGTKNVSDLCFLEEDSVASIEYGLYQTEFFNTYNGREVQENIYDLKDGKILWQSQKTRTADTIAVDKPVVFCENIGEINVDSDGEREKVVGFCCEGNLILIRKDSWDIVFQRNFEYNIVAIQKIDDNNILVGLNNGTVYRVMTCNFWSKMLVVDADIGEVYYNAKADKIVQTKAHDLVFSRKIFDESMKKKGTERPELENDVTNNAGEKVVGTKYTAEVEGDSIVITDKKKKETVLTIPMYQAEDMVYGFFNEDKQFLIYNARADEIIVWDMETRSILKQEEVKLESPVKSQIIIDEDLHLFALNLEYGNISFTAEESPHNTLDLFYYDDEFNIYRYASIPYGDIDFKNKKLYVRDGQDYYSTWIYSYDELVKKAEKILKEK